MYVVLDLELDQALSKHRTLMKALEAERRFRKKKKATCILHNEGNRINQSPWKEYSVHGPEKPWWLN